MVDLSIWALGISMFSLIVSILSVIAQIAGTFNNWKKPEIRIILFPRGELKKIKEQEVVDLHVNVELTNLGNQDTFITSIYIYHLEQDGSKTGISVGHDIKLPAYNNQEFNADFFLNYIPEEESPYQGYDKIVVIAVDNKNKKFVDEMYYKVDKENNKINSWMSFGKKDYIKELNKEQKMRLNKYVSSKDK